MVDTEKLLEIFMNVKNAADISEGTLDFIVGDDAIEDERVIWILYGVLDQIRKIQKEADKIDSIMKGSANE